MGRQSELRGDPSGIGDDLLAQITNGPDVDMDMDGELRHADPPVVGHPEPGVSPKERVSSINEAERILC